MRNRGKIACLFILFVSSCMLTACGARQRVNPFTSQKDLAKYEAAPAPKALKEVPGVMAEKWALKGPFDPVIGLRPRRSVNDLDHMMDKGVSTRQGLTHSEGMHCVAREFAAFYLEKQALPEETLASFIKSRCGSLAQRVFAYKLVHKKRSPDDVWSSSQAVTNSQSGIFRWLDMLATAGVPAEVGISIEESDTQAVLMVTAGFRYADINTVPMHVQGTDKVVFEGKLHTRAVRVLGFVTQGDYDATQCVTDTRVALPSFRVTCPVRSTDARSMITLSIIRLKGSLFTMRLGRYFVWSAIPPQNEYVSSKNSQVFEGLNVPDRASAEQLPTMLLSMINAIRKKAGVKPLSLSSAQSKKVQALFPHILESVSKDTKDDDKKADKITMGLLAGWDVKGDIVGAKWASEAIVAHDPKQLLASLLETPAGRLVLLHPDRNALAIGSVVGKRSLRAAFVTYDFLKQETFAKRSATIYKHINKARKLNGRKKTKRLKKFYSEAEKLSKWVASGQISPRAAGERLATTVNQSTEASVAYYTLDLLSLTDWEVPKALLDSKKLRAAVMVAPFKPKGFPWTIYTVTIVVVQ